MKNSANEIVLVQDKRGYLFICHTDDFRYGNEFQLVKKGKYEKKKKEFIGNDGKPYKVFRDYSVIAL